MLTLEQAAELVGKRLIGNLDGWVANSYLSTRSVYFTLGLGVVADHNDIVWVRPLDSTSVFYVVDTPSHHIMNVYRRELVAGLNEILPVTVRIEDKGGYDPKFVYSAGAGETGKFSPGDCAAFEEDGFPLFPSSDGWQRMDPLEKLSLALSRQSG